MKPCGLNREGASIITNSKIPRGSFLGKGLDGAWGPGRL